MTTGLSSLPNRAQAVVERAVLSFARSILATDGSDLRVGFCALLEATGADSAYVERNEDVPGVGLTSRAVARVTRQEDRSFAENWDRFSWAESPAQYETLSSGAPWVVDDPATLPEADRHFYLSLDPPIRAELALPIFVRGEFAGHVAFAHLAGRYAWSEEEIEALRMVAEMIGLVWERQADLERYVRVSEEREGALKVAQALLECSQALLRGTDDESIERAMAALLGASGAGMAFVGVNTDHARLGACMDTRYAAVSPRVDSEAVRNYFGRVPWSIQPATYELMQTGDMLVAESLDEVPPSDRDFFRASGVRAEISVPVFIGDAWVACVGLADVCDRRWSAAERQMMGAVADMFAAYWRRERTEVQLRDLLEAKDRFVASVSHELRTPLSAVVGFATELRDHGQEFDQDLRDQMIDLVARQATDVGHMVDDLLVVARAEHAQLSVSPGPIDPVAEIETVIDALPDACLSRVELRRVEAREGWADPHRYRQIVRNLLINACRYGGERCFVDVFVRDGRIVTRVADTGQGIAVSDRASIFEPYRSLAAAAGSLPSIGLGLTVCRQLSRLMGGEITYVRDDESAFEVSLPRVDPAA